MVFDWVQLGSIVFKNGTYFHGVWLSSTGFNCVRKWNIIKLSQKYFSLILFIYRTNQTKSFDSVRLGLIKFDYQTVPLVTSGTKQVFFFFFTSALKKTETVDLKSTYKNIWQQKNLEVNIYHQPAKLISSKKKNTII